MGEEIYATDLVGWEDAWKERVLRSWGGTGDRYGFGIMSIKVIINSISNYRISKNIFWLVK